MSTSSREYSPDWLRNAQAPTTSICLPSSSESEDDKDDQLPISSVTKKASQVSKGNKKVANPEKPTKPQALPSDSEYEDQHQHQHHLKEEEEESSQLLPKKRLKMETEGKALTKEEDDGDLKVLERETTTTEKKTATYVSSSRLPLVVADKVQRSKALVECEGESIDLSGDLGSVGRVVVSDSNQDVLLDLKGTIYKMTILPSRTFCVVSFGQSEAKIEAIMDDFIQLKPQSNVYEAETMVEGTLEGFSFDSEDEEAAGQTAAAAADENTAEPPHANGKPKPKPKPKPKADKTFGAAKKKGKTAVKKQPAKRKAPAAAKKSKPKK